MKKILVTGGNGQLGSSLRKISASYQEFNFAFIDYDDLDLTKSDEVNEYFRNHPTDYIINCAAFTAVDKAESQQEMAFSVNAGIPRILSGMADINHIRLLHISTDYVYDGKLSLPHRENEKPAPESAYAQSKLEGEKALWDNPSALIIRTSWLYGEFGKNFLRSMLHLGNEKKELGVVFDQTGTPTYSGDLAHTLMEIISYAEKNEFIPGIYNYSNEGVCSWYDFAREIMILGGKNCFVKPIRTSDYPLPAKRPEYSVLDKSKIKQTFGIEIPHWKDSLSTALANLKKNKEI
ncbi:MAG: dTDP-4-dehydrorhamnose reductase [Methanobacteriota archaeon]|nr:MAG: dTDP-4-dehydrorhamnose reductase [Euryarchaeota archaeon]